MPTASKIDLTSLVFGNAPAPRKPQPQPVAPTPIRPVEWRRGVSSNPLTISLECIEGPNQTFELDTTEDVAREVAVQRFHANKNLRTIAILRNGKVIDVYDGEWQSQRNAHLPDDDSARPDPTIDAMIQAWHAAGDIIWNNESNQWESQRCKRYRFA